MASSGRSRTRAKSKPKPKSKPKSKPATKSRTTQCKKRLAKSKNIQEASSSIENMPSCSSTTTSLKLDGFDFEGVDVDDHISTSACSTPKAQKFRIPEIMTCPPAPKKQRMASNCSLRRKPIAFFAPPDIELFFFYALNDISA